MLGKLVSQRFLRGALIAAIAVTTGCGGESPKKPSGKPEVVVTTTQIGDLVRQIGARRIELKVLMGPGVSPHLYKPTDSDVAAMRRADVVLYNGLGLDDRVIEAPGEDLGEKAVGVSDDMPERMLIPAGDGAYDPHVWFDVRLWQMAAAAVTIELVRIDPEGQPAYRYNLLRLRRDMEGMADYARTQIAKVPESRRVLIVSHNAFAYLGKAYGLTVLSLQDVPDIVDIIVRQKVPAVFVERSFPPQTIDRVKAECKARGVDLKGGAGSGLELYSDTLGKPGEREDHAVETYLGMMRYNIETIVKALGEGS